MSLIIPLPDTVLDVTVKILFCCVHFTKVGTDDIVYDDVADDNADKDIVDVWFFSKTISFGIQYVGFNDGDIAYNTSTRFPNVMLDQNQEVVLNVAGSLLT